MGVTVCVGVALGAGVGEGMGVLAGISIAGAQAERIASRRKKAGNFFIRLFCHKYKFASVMNC
jgi:hypothetical protein